MASEIQDEDRLPDVTPQAFHDAADTKHDRHDHDELHAAGEILRSDPIYASTTPYVTRWLAGLVKFHDIPVDP